MDFKYWDPNVISKIDDAIGRNGKSICDINTIPTQRGKSPNAEDYVDESDGFAIVIKAGSNISRFGEIIIDEHSDWIQKSTYNELFEQAKENESNLNIICSGDILLSSTGEGTLGKCAVYRGELPAIADGHVTIIRVNSKKIYPEYLADYLRCGFGSAQIHRLFTGSTGLIELTPEDVDRIIIEIPSKLKDQIKISKVLRTAEKEYTHTIKCKEAELANIYKDFLFHNNKFIFR
jgi:type I restriction enzyme M protein